MNQNNLYTIYDLTGLSEVELAEVLAKNPRSYMAVKGAVAEKHLEKILTECRQKSLIKAFRPGEGDFAKDFYVTLTNEREVALECKTIQVLNVQNKALVKEYILFLVDRGYIKIENIKEIIETKEDCQRHLIESLYINFKNLEEMRYFLSFQRKGFLDEIKKSLPIELKSSGMARYDFSVYLLSYDSVCNVDSETFLRQFDEYPLSIDFQRTRNVADENNQNDKNRFYKLDEIDAVAGCLFTRTKRWEFIYARTDKFAASKNYPDRFSSRLTIHPEYWTTDLKEVLSSFA